MDVDGLLLDIDGVLTVSWEPIDGAIDTLDRLRDRGLPFRLITNTTTHTRDALAATLRTAGFTVDADDIITAVVATAAYIRAAHPGANGCPCCPTAMPVKTSKGSPSSGRTIRRTSW